MRRCYEVTPDLSLVQAEDARLSQPALTAEVPRRSLCSPALLQWAEPPAPHQARNPEEIRAPSPESSSVVPDTAILAHPAASRHSGRGTLAPPGPAVPALPHTAPAAGPGPHRPLAAPAGSAPGEPEPAGTRRSGALRETDWQILSRETARPGCAGGAVNSGDGSTPSGTERAPDRGCAGWVHVRAAGVSAGARAQLRAGLAPAAASGAAAARAGSFAIASSIIPSSPVPFTPHTSDCLGLNVTRGNNTNSLSQRRNQLLRHLLWKGL